jgi:hypothetical protein
MTWPSGPWRAAQPRTLVAALRCLDRTPRMTRLIEKKGNLTCKVDKSRLIEAAERG